VINSNVVNPFNFLSSSQWLLLTDSIYLKILKQFHFFLFGEFLYFHFQTQELIILFMSSIDRFEAFLLFLYTSQLVFYFLVADLHFIFKELPFHFCIYF